MCLGTVVGLKIKPINAGLLPRCITELKIAKFSLPSNDWEPIRFADLYPVTLFIRLRR